MKKKLLFAKGAKRWNNLLAKFTKLQKRVELLSSNTNTSLYKKLVSKMENIFSKLEKMQYQTGIKLAGTSLAVILSAFTANAQFAAGTTLIHTGNIYENGLSKSAFADIDADGDDDLYVNSYFGTIEVFINNNGIYTKGANLQAAGVDISVSNNSSPVFADVDGDGDLDLYVGRNNGNIITYTNNNGNFTGAGFLQVSGSIIDVGNNAIPEFVDIDGDGDLDLYIGNTIGEVHEFTNNNGVFTANGILGLTDAFTLQSVVGLYSAPAFADIDGDGDLDLYSGSNSGFIAWFSNVNGAFTSEGHLQSNLNVDIAPGIKTKPSFRDADNDGDLDLYINAKDNNIFLYTNNTGVFTAAGKVQANDIPVNVGGYSSPAFADIDGDGDLDLYVGKNSGQLEVFTNNNGDFTGIGNLQSIGVTYSSAPTFTDIDGDGDLDLYIGNYDGTIKKFNNANGTFTSAGDVQAGGATLDIGYYARPTFADIDGDGDLDLYVGKYGNTETFINNAGVFTSAGNLQAAGIDIDANYRSSPTFADLDSDGDLDLYIGSDNGKISVYINTNGVFGASTNLQASAVDIDAGFYSAPIFADVDGDGDLDLYVGNYDGNVMFYENTSITAILVSSIAVQGAGGASTITTQGGTLQMSATVLPANADDGTYFWSIVNQTGTASISANGILTAITDGVVSVRATANDGSGVTGAKSITISNQTVGINEINSQNISIYPNPVNNKLFVEVENQQVTNMVIIDYSGRTVKSIANNNTNSIDVSDLTQGVYILKIATKEGVSTNRFIKK